MLLRCSNQSLQLSHLKIQPVGASLGIGALGCKLGEGLEPGENPKFCCLDKINSPTELEENI